MASSPGPMRRDGGSAGHRKRRAARRQAIDLLYQADVTGSTPSLVTQQWRAAGRSISPYAQELVSGVEGSLDELDAVLADHSEGWAVHRMAVVDRTILRVACYELRAGLPEGVVINEAVEAANQLSTEDSGRFINGILGRIAREMPPDPAG
jgi:transcription antitermination protein NusB